MDVAPTAIGDLVRGVTLPGGVRWVGSGGRGQVGGLNTNHSADITHGMYEYTRIHKMTHETTP